MATRPLLERLEHPDAPESRNLPGDPQGAVDSIRRNLQMMLNTRHGGSITAPDYGTSDFSDVFRGHQSIQLIQNQIGESIEKYEPRLVDADVSFLEGEDPYQIHFNITATIVSEEGETPAVFRTVIESSGEVRVK